MKQYQFIFKSKWWELARKTRDRHFSKESNETLAEHLLDTAKNIRMLLNEEYWFNPNKRITRSLIENKFDIQEFMDILIPVALLHDIGKLADKHSENSIHPVTATTEKNHHSVVGVKIASEILPDDYENKDIILTLIESHDLPYKWFKSFNKHGKAIKIKELERIEECTSSNRKGTGLLLLVFLKYADIHGHKNMEDAIWFADQMNTYLSKSTINIPTLSVDDLRLLQRSRIYYIHEDDWGEISFIPKENMEERKRILEEKDKFSEKHKTDLGWTDVYVIPEEKVSISERAIPLAELDIIIGKILPRAGEIHSGYSSYREIYHNCFAYGKSYDLSVYGCYKDGIITQLHFMDYDLDMEGKRELVKQLMKLGKKHSLALIDYINDSIVDFTM